MRTLHRSTPPREELAAKPVRLGATCFRSRLEARWSIWFDGLGVAWEYEPEGYRVHGRWRWPDFWLPRQACYVEIKPRGFLPDEELALGVAEASGSPLIWLAGEPWPGSYEATWFPRADLPPVRGLRWATGRTDTSELWLCHIGQVWAVRLGESPVPLAWEAALGGPRFPAFQSSMLLSAYRAASTYRFEEE